MKKQRAWVHLGVLCAVSVSLSLLEGFFAPLLPPGVKPGLSNIATVLAAGYYGVWAALAVSLCKALFALFVRGGVAFAMSLAGGVLSALCTAALLLWVRGRLGSIGICVLGALVHNAAQLGVATLILGRAALGYGPILILAAVGAGCVTGVVLHATWRIVLRRTKREGKPT